MEHRELKCHIRRTQFLINKRFQLRYMGVFVGAALVASLGVGGILFYIVEINAGLQGAKGLSLFPEVTALLSQQRNLVLMAFVISFLIVGGMVSLWGLFLSHRVAGPVFAISRRMQKIVREHDLVTSLHLRKKDSLQEVKDFLNETVSTFREKIKNEIAIWGAFSNQLSDLKEEPLKSQAKSLLRKVDGIKKDKEKWVHYNAR